MINELLINPNSIVVIGASNNIMKPGGKVLKNIIDGEFKGKLYAVNPKSDIIQNIKSYRDIKELPNVDLAIISIPAKFINLTVKELIDNHQTKAFIVLSAGFSEIGENKLEDELVSIIKNGNGSLIGPNCMGVLTPYYAGSFGGPIPKLDKNGVDFASGSGATAAFILENGIEMGLNFASMYSVGNSADIGVEDIVEYWDKSFNDSSSKSKLLYLEKIDNPNKLLKHAKSLISKGCKIAAIKAGSSDAGSRAASSHTGALASSDDAVDVLFKKAGIIRCYSRLELVTAGAIFQYKELTGKNIAIITHAGGPGVILTDGLSKGGLNIPEIKGKYADQLLSKLYHGSSVSNPIDFLATGTAEQLGIIIDYVNDYFDNIDAICVIFGSPGLFDVSDVYELLYKKIQSSKKPIYPILPSTVTAKKEVEYFLKLGGINFSDELFFANMLSRIFNIKKTTISKEDIDFLLDVKSKINNKKIRKIVEESKDGYLKPQKVVALLDAVDIDRVKEYVITSKEELSNIEKKLSYPIVMKAVGPIHKSDVGGVILNIDQKDIFTNFENIMKIKDATSVLIQPMINGMELFIGGKYEENFGHLVLAGLGGIFIEVFKDVSKALGVISKTEALNMINSLKSVAILDGTRGQKGINKNKFAETIVKLSLLLMLAPEIKELDINPLLANEKDVVAVDARIKIG